MKQHFESISQFKVRRTSEDFSHEQDGDKKLIMRMCIKAADLCHAALDWQSHYEWSVKVTEEFYLQGDEEARLGLPKSPLCDREKQDGFAQGQMGFLKFVVKPLFAELCEVDADGIVREICISRLQQNEDQWAEIAARSKPREITEGDEDEEEDRDVFYEEDEDEDGETEPTEAQEKEEEAEKVEEEERVSEDVEAE
eukprot:GHVU01165867.1.p1 GENE.GHVU01165867.1~~GHVU01165867.1.p1  ORF type:complete len:197 (+),score=65.11 GHVU01165867.1:968-1558(+)